MLMMMIFAQERRGEKMSDLIDRQAAMNAFAERVKRSNNSDFAPVPRWNDAVEIVENLPSVDAVEIVRCEDCKHWYSDADSGMACEFTNMSQPEDGFCNWAERRQDDG